MASYREKVNILCGFALLPVTCEEVKTGSDRTNLLNGPRPASTIYVITVTDYIHILTVEKRKRSYFHEILS
jgi:hypothetical protein